jgi:hypothetical protein
LNGSTKPLSGGVPMSKMPLELDAFVNVLLICVLALSP